MEAGMVSICSRSLEIHHLLFRHPCRRVAILSLHQVLGKAQTRTTGRCIAFRNLCQDEKALRMGIIAPAGTVPSIVMRHVNDRVALVLQHAGNETLQQLQNSPRAFPATRSMEAEA